MKENSKPSGKMALVDTKPISIPMISSTTPASPAPAPAPVPVPAPAVHGILAGVKSISRSQVASRPGMVSRATQTGDAGEGDDLLEKRRLIRKQLAVLLHAVLCRVRDELIGNTGREARPCPTAFCGLMKNVLNHLRTCDARENCPHPHCLSSRQILSHWKSCTQTDCPVCSSLRRVVPAYLEAVVQNPRWREEIMARFQWLITFVGPAHLRIPQQPQQQQQPQSRSESEEEQRERNCVKNCEE